MEESEACECREWEISVVIFAVCELDALMVCESQTVSLHANLTLALRASSTSFSLPQELGVSASWS